jgi:hypothetical protein
MFGCPDGGFRFLLYNNSLMARRTPKAIRFILSEFQSHPGVCHVLVGDGLQMIPDNNRSRRGGCR